jgi:hypothetical protein
MSCYAYMLTPVPRAAGVKSSWIDLYSVPVQYSVRVQET